MSEETASWNWTILTILQSQYLRNLLNWNSFGTTHPIWFCM